MKFNELFNTIMESVKKKRDRCLKKADQVYGKKPSLYKGGAIAKCRQGKIWKKR